jgi:hypothetical protein
MRSVEAVGQELSHEDPLAHSFTWQALVKQVAVDSVTCGQAVYSAVHIRQYKCSWDFARGKRNFNNITASEHWRWLPLGCC